MSLIPFFIIPGLTCFFWVLVHACLASRTETFRIVMFLFLAIFFTAAGDTLVGSAIGSDSVARLVLQGMAPCIIPLAYMYFFRLLSREKYRTTQLLWISLPVMLFTASLILTSFNGLDATDAFLERLFSSQYNGTPVFTDGIERTFYIWSIVIFRLVMLGEVLFLAVYFSILAIRLRFSFRHLWGFLFKGRRIRIAEMQVYLASLVTLGLCFKLFLHDRLFLIHPYLNVSIALVVSLLLLFFGLFALFGAREALSREEIATALRFNYTPESRSHVAEEVVLDMVDALSGESLTHVLSRIGVQSDAESLREAGNRPEAPSLASAIFSAVSKSWDEDSLLSRFQHLMMEEQLFLMPGLTLTDVANRLHSNKTYVSKMVNQTYNLGFPEVLNILRVDYAEQYIRKHADATQEEIAKACGFLSASSFNSTFKRITGYTPKVWAARKANN